MPVPKPGAGESEDDFVSRCISTLHKTDPDRPDDQIIAMCFTAWRDKEELSPLEKLNPNAHADFTQYYNDFIDLFGKEDGDKKYHAMLASYGLDDTQSYGSQLTRECLNGVCEAFNWTKPLIQYLRKDEGGKYYKVRALTATLSANKNDYTNLEDLERSARTLIWRPLNLNHDPLQTLPFPRNRVDWADYEDKAVEAIIRIDNEEKDIQDKLDNGAIVNPSIEGEPRGGLRTEDGRNIPKFYNFTALALLEKDVTLPGVPTTYGFEPLFLNESLGRSLVESLSLEQEKEKNTMFDQEKVEPKEEDIKEAVTEKAVHGMDQCGQCKFFMELLDTTTSAPAAPGSDATVTHTAGSIGPAVGRCTISEALVKKNDPACTDGRLRDQPTNLDRTIETMSEINLKSEIADLKNEVLQERQATNKEREKNIKTLQEMVEKDSKIADLTKTKSQHTSEIKRLKEERLRLRDEGDRKTEENTTLEVRLGSLEKDHAFIKDENTRLNESIDTARHSLAETKEELTKALTKANEESTKRAQDTQRALNAEGDKARAIQELATATAEVAARTREISDMALRLNEYAKRQLVDAKTIDEWRKKHSNLVEEYRELKQLYNALKDRKKIRINVKT